jgi:hypothetical protein
VSVKIDQTSYAAFVAGSFVSIQFLAAIRAPNQTAT